jgi:hypothetical protein
MVDEDELERFIDKGIAKSKAKGYYPRRFEQMRADYRKQGKTTEQLIKDLVISGEIQSGFKEMKKLDLLEWSLEAGVRKFPSRFDRDTYEAATWRFEHIDS